MSTEENIAVVRRWLEEIGNAGKLEVVDEIYAPTFVDHAAMPDQLPGPEGVKQFIRMIKAVFPDWHYTIEDLIADGDKVVARVTMRGTHQGTWFGVPPTGKQVITTAIQIHRIAEGKIQETWANADILSMMYQIGVSTLPSMG